MNKEVYQHKPTLLVTSDCLPSRSGTRNQRRLWQLLKTGTLTHHVCLAAIINQPVNLQQWCEADGLADRIIIETVNRAIRSDLRQSADLSTWLREHTVDILISSLPVWPASVRIKAPLRICDCDIPASRRHRIQAARSPLIRRWWHLRQYRLSRRREAQAARQADMVLVSRPGDASILLTRAHQTTVVPMQDARVLHDMLHRQALAQQARRANLSETGRMLRPAA